MALANKPARGSSVGEMMSQKGDLVSIEGGRWDLPGAVFCFSTSQTGPWGHQTKPSDINKQNPRSQRPQECQEIQFLENWRH